MPTLDLLTPSPAYNSTRLWHEAMRLWSSLSCSKSNLITVRRNQQLTTTNTASNVKPAKT